MNPPEALCRLIYSSFACPGLKLSEITSFLEIAQKRNESNGVSGALVFAEGAFLQLLEGSRESVSETFSRIQRDNRHQDICLIDFSACPNRLFSGWAMRHLGFKPDCAEGKFEPRVWSAEEAVMFFERFQLAISE